MFCMPVATKFKSVVPLLPRHHREFLNCLEEAVDSAQEGEVIVRSDTLSGRVYTTQKSIGWAVVSTEKKTLGTQLVGRGLLEPEELKEVLKECKRSGSNFGKTIIDWGLVDEDTLRQEFLTYIADTFLEILSWPALQTMFVPSSRPTYRGTLLFDLDEVLEKVIDTDADGLAGFERRLSYRHPDREQQSKFLRISSSAAQPRSIDPTGTHVSAIVPKKASRRESPIFALKLPDRAVKECFEDLNRAHGFRAIGIFETPDKLLRSEPSNSVQQLTNAALHFQEILEKSRITCDALGWASPCRIILNAERGGVLYHEMDLDEQHRIYLLALAASESSYTLIQLIMEKLIRSIIIDKKR